MSPAWSRLICNAPEGKTTTRESPGTGMRSCWFFCQCIVGMGSPMTSHLSNTVSPTKAVIDSVWERNLRGPKRNTMKKGWVIPIQDNYQYHVFFMWYCILASILLNYAESSNFITHYNSRLGKKVIWLRYDDNIVTYL